MSMDHKFIPELSLFHDKVPVQLRFNDVDVLGHVNNTVYFSFYDTGKAHYFSAVKGKPVDWKHVDAVIANVNCTYVAPIFFGEDIEVLTACLSVGEKSFKLMQAIRETKKGHIKSYCETVMVCFDPETMKTIDVEPRWREALNRFEGRDLDSREK